MKKVGVQCRHVHLAFGRTEVLRDVDLEIAPGEFFAQRRDLCSPLWIGLGVVMEDTNPASLIRPLGESRQRPRRRPAEQTDELAPPEHAFRPPTQGSKHSSRGGDAKGAMSLVWGYWLLAGLMLAVPGMIWFSWCLLRRVYS